MRNSLLGRRLFFRKFHGPLGGLFGDAITYGMANWPPKRRQSAAIPGGDSRQQFLTDTNSE